MKYTGRWLVKIRRYDGSTSVLKRYDSYTDARHHVLRLNTETQSKTHYVEAEHE
jgi:hypothetical protein